MINELATLTKATGAWVDETRQCIWVALESGRVTPVPFGGGAGGASAALRPAAVSIAGAGATIAAVSANGQLSTLDASRPTQAARLVSKLNLQCGQMVMRPPARPATKASVVIVTRDGATKLTTRPGLPILLRGNLALTTVNLDDGTTSTLKVAGLTGVALVGKSVYLARNAGTPQQGQIGLLRGLTVQTMREDLPPVGRLGVTGDGASLLVAHPGSSALSQVTPGQPVVRTVPTTVLPGTLIEAHGLRDGRIAVLTTDVLALIDALDDLVVEPIPPSIRELADPIFVSAWTPIRFDLGESGLSVDEIDFVVPEGPEAGLVSFTRENGVGDPVPLLIAGGKVGDYRLDMIERATNTVLASTQFSVTDHWRDPDTGPSGFYTTDSSWFADGGWGGGPDAPQNLNTQPHVGTWRTLVMMVDTATARWPTAAATMAANQADLMGHMTDGFDVGGVARSVRQYYEENSRYVAGASPARGLTITVHDNRVFGPVNLPQDWDDYFAQTVDDAGNIIDARWMSIQATKQTIISRAIADGIATTDDFNQVDVVIFVPFSPAAGGGAANQFVWPHAWGKHELLCGTNVMTDKRQLAIAFGPLDFAARDGRQFHTTMSHELGHTMGLPDLYASDDFSADINARLTYDWDMMAGSRDALPHYSLSNKMRMGWVDASHLKRYDFKRSGAVSESVTLHAAELWPITGRFSGLEIRLGDGYNYYVEYRAQQATHISDTLPANQRVLITDVVSEHFSSAVARPPIVLVRQDIDGDGPVLPVGADFEDKDPGTQMDLTVEVVSAAADNAVVKVSYGANGKPEPGIRPWNGAPNWQSPDIEVRNAKSAADSRYDNVPWLGHSNTVVAKIHNAGDLLAVNVGVDFYVTEYTSGDGPWIPLGTDFHDVPAGDTVEFSVEWSPPATEGRHYCVIVRIRQYQDPGNLAILDQNPWNNEARSNYTQFVSASASPSSRVGAEVLLSNPFSRPTNVYADVRKTHRLHRVYVDHQWLRVPARGQRPIRVWDEALFGTREWGMVADKREQRSPSYLYKEPNRVSVAGWADRPFKADCGAKRLTGGVGLRVDAGRATKIEIKRREASTVSGTIYYADNGAPITAGGRALIVVTTDGKEQSVNTEVGANGQFADKIAHIAVQGKSLVVVHYLGQADAAPCESETIAV